MQTTGSNVGRNQNIQRAFSEVFQNAKAFFLRDVTGQQTDAVSVGSQMAPDIFTTVFGVCKNNATIRPFFFNQRL
ncbi:hypothetical protein SRABI106_00956 [Rahnella aquatilis]|nr:hypothetical protein SRABI106_00956 [Rahnella aquatilis]